MLKISNDLSLPIEAVTQTFAIMAKRGVGKTHTASVMAEEMLGAGQQIVCLDPTGAWWGLQSKYPVVIFGGEYANVPLEESSGAVIAQAIIEHGFSAIIDLSLFRKNQMIRFMVAFAETLYRLNRKPVHLFVDEADAVAPQQKNYGGDENRMLGAMEDIVRRGRKRGIGCTLISQRPAVINKNVLTQCEVLCAMRLVHPKDISAIKEWINVHADPDTAKEMIDSLPSLPVGTAWLWSPGWGDFFKKIKIRERYTFDSGATPKPGEVMRKPKSLVEVDLAALGEQIRATVETAKANDPAALRKEIVRLQRELESKAPAGHEVLNAAAANGYTKGFNEAVVAHNKFTDMVEDRVAKLNQVTMEYLGDELSKLCRDIANQRGISRAMSIEVSPAHHQRRAEAIASVALDHNSKVCTNYEVNGTEKLGKCERAILAVLAQYPHGKTKNQAGVISGYSTNSGGFANALSSLRRLGLMTGDASCLKITPHAFNNYGPFELLPIGRELANYWMRQLGKCEAAILHYAIEEYPNSVTKEQMGKLTNYSVHSSGFSNALSRLRTLELIERRGEIKASENLF